MASGGKQPKPEDPELAAAAQARWNRTNVTGPFGSQVWDGNTQVITPSDSLMSMFAQAQGIAQGGAERYKPPSNFGDIQSATMGRLQQNTYQPGSRAIDSKVPIDDTSLAKGTPWRDAFFGEKDPVSGDRRTLRHILTGGLQGAIPRGIGNMVDEYRDRRGGQLPGPVGVGSPSNSPIEQTGFTPAPLGRIAKPERGMPGPVSLDPIAPSPIGRNDSKPSAARLSPTRGLGRKPTKREMAAMRKDPNSILYRGNDSPLFTSMNAGLFNANDTQTGSGQGFAAAQEAARRMLQPNRNFVS